ncbi:hypothetical protein SAMN04487936_10442 [Halobacillus dabanensis]|uniref:Uncharacterized protein n=2 Tax=Halobacillus dabanensis TaxID=240302 RepID=A0A1I3U071_HALDA|nr:hypothetical protein SAMN04487936_10442 [Halobacillus dabanensis]
MKTILLSSSHKKNDLCLTPARVVFYEQMQVIETYDDQAACYMLFFYKQKFLTAVKTKRMKVHSYLARSFREGTVYEAPHPFLQALVDSNTPLRKISYPQLKKKMERDFSRQEQAKILTYFESFIPKKQLFQDIKAIFYHYRREGSMSGAYRIIRVLIDFAPNNRFVKEVANDLSFRKIQGLYLEESKTIFERDSLFAEAKAAYDDRLLLLEKEKRWIEVSAYLMAALYDHPTSERYQAYRNFTQKYFDPGSRALLLEQLSRSIPALEGVTEDLLQQYLLDEKLKEIAFLFKERDVVLDEKQLGKVALLLEKDGFRTNPEQFSPIMKRLYSENPDQAGVLFEKYVAGLLEVLELEDVHNKLQEFPQKSPLARKIERMNQIREDLDCMQELGELYYEFNQLDRALECFQMEMELKPSDPEPLRWLSKVYADKQMIQESKTYQQLCVDVQKWA